MITLSNKLCANDPEELQSNLIDLTNFDEIKPAIKITCQSRLRFKILSLLGVDLLTITGISLKVSLSLVYA